MDQYGGSTGHSTYCYAELAVSFLAVAGAIASTHYSVTAYRTGMAGHPLSTSSIIARHLLDFMVQGKITEADALTVCLNANPSRLSVPPPLSSTIFTLNALSAATLPIYLGLRQALSNSGLVTQ